MKEEKEDQPFNYKKPSLVLFFIMVVVVIFVLGIDWLFSFLFGKH